MAKILVYDLETTDLDPEWGKVLVFGYKWIGEKKIHSPSVLDYHKPCNEGRLHYSEDALLREAHKVLSEADIFITFNGKNFDLGVLNTKFMRLRLPALPEIAHIDLYQVAKTKMRIRPKSLRHIAQYLKLKHQKLDIDREVWGKAREGDAKSIKFIRDHCDEDILVTEELYLDHLRPYVRQHPRVNGYGNCRRCGEDALIRRGPVVTIHKGQQYRFSCKKCGGNETRAV